MRYLITFLATDGMHPFWFTEGETKARRALEVGELGLDTGWTNTVAVCVLPSILLCEFSNWSGSGRGFQTARTLCAKEMVQVAQAAWAEL